MGLSSSADRSRPANIFLSSKQKSSPLYFQEGAAVVDSYLATLLATHGCEVEVGRICIYKTPLRHDLRQRQAEEQQGPEASKKMLQVYHHFLIVEVSRVRHPELPGFKIRAEKSGPDPQNKGSAGITVNNVPVIVEGEAAEEHYCVDAANFPILLNILIGILTSHNPDYDLVRDNCWKYADTTYKALVNTILQVQQQGQPLAAPASGNCKKQNHMNIGERGNEKLASNLREMPPLVMPIDHMKRAAVVTGGIIVVVGGLTWVLTSGIKRLMSSQDEEDEEEKTKVPG